MTDYNTASGCDGGGAYQCSNESPWAVSDDLAYGYAAVNIAGGSESSWCCACYELTFTSGPVAGKKMVVQATNTGGDLAGNQFDISVCSLTPPSPHTIKQSLTYLDAWWRCRNFQWLHARMGSSKFRMGRSIRRHLVFLVLFELPSCSPGWMQLALQLVCWGR